MFESPAFQRVLERLAARAVHDPSDTEVRMVVQARARDACEYCLMPTRSRFEIDHIIPVSRWQAYLDGRLAVQPREGAREGDHLDNFAWSCSYCNESKGNRVSGRVDQRMYRLFHPRHDHWGDHFLLTNGCLRIEGLTEIGKATERALAFNNSRGNGPIVARHKAILDGIYPPAWARGWGF
jgi:hypothetical protein